MAVRAVLGWIALVVTLDGAAGLVGGLVPERALARWRPILFGFAAGSLLVSGALEILPDAVGRIGPVALAWALAALLALAAFETVMHRRGAHLASPVHPAALLGSDALHNFGDGMAIAAAFLVSPRVGVVTSLAVILHELPQELADYALLRAAPMSRRAALGCLALVQLTAALGAAGGLLAAAAMPDIVGVVLAIAAGMFIWIAIFDLCPPLVRARRLIGVFAFVAGGGLAALA